MSHTVTFEIYCRSSAGASAVTPMFGYSGYMPTKSIQTPERLSELQHWIRGELKS